MTLFKTSDLVVTTPADNTLSAKGFKQVARSTQRLIKSRRTLESIIGELVADQVLQFATAGRWSLHQLLEYVLAQTGPASVWMTTWTITEEPMRVLLNLIKSGSIRELHAVFDYRIESRKPEAFQLASNILTRIKLTKCHAKVLVIQNERWSVTILGSANFSNNPRIEAGTLFTDRASADFHKNWISEVIDGKEVFRGK